MKSLTKKLATIALLGFAIHTHAQTITTILGDGTAAFSGENILAVSAQTNHPSAVVVDKKGNKYIASPNDDRIRKIDSLGIITTIAGTGINGFSGNFGPATSAELSFPTWLALDKKGNIYICDNGNNMIRKIDTFGIIITVAGTGPSGYNGDGIPATTAQLSHPSGIFVDSVGNLYINDDFNSRIRKVDTFGMITTIGGNGTMGYAGDNNPATSAEFTEIRGITMDDTGNIIVADQGNNRIRKISAATGIITTIAGTGVAGYSGNNGPATAAEINSPAAVTVDTAGNVYFSEAIGNRIRKIDKMGIITDIAGTGVAGFGGDNGTATAAVLSSPYGLAIGDSGIIYFADDGNNRVRKIYTPDTTHSTTSISTGTKDNTTVGIFPNPNNGVFFVNISSAATSEVRIIISDLLGKQIKEMRSTTNKALEIAIDEPSGIYFVSTIINGITISKKMEILR